MIRVMALWVAGIALVGCATVLHEFDPDRMAAFSASQDWSCPPKRLTVAESPGETVPNLPSDEIARDPERLAIWRKNQLPLEHRPRSYLVSGCGNSALYVCRWVSFESSGTSQSAYGCMAK
jgi:hypothetical protein